MKTRDRFAPPLMYAFRAAFNERDARKVSDRRDESGERLIAGRRVSPRNMVDDATLRQELSADLAALLNTVALNAIQDLSQHGFVARSVLNYGLADLTAISIDEAAVESIGAELRQVFSHHEPRLIPESIEIERDRSIDSTELKLRFLVHAEMHASPQDVPVEFVADLELDSGKMRVAPLSP